MCDMCECALQKMQTYSFQLKHEQLCEHRQMMLLLTNKYEIVSLIFLNHLQIDT